MPRSIDPVRIRQWGAALRRVLVIVLPLFLLDATCESVWAKKTTLRGVLLGAQAVPPVPTTGRGAASFTYDAVGRRLTYEIAYSDLSSPETVAHIHGPALPGQNAGVVHPLPPGSPKRGTWEVPEALEADLLGGRLYVNIHTSMHPSGELRAQIGDLAAILGGSQPVPPNESAGTGWGTFTLDPCQRTLRYHIVRSPLEGVTAAHLHGPAVHGENAGVLHPLTTGEVMSGVANYSDWGMTAEEILQGGVYVNVHTSKFPGGEIRGQVTGAVAVIDGGQENPPTETDASGIGFFSIHTGDDVLGYHVVRSMLSGAETGAHIHGFASRGQNAGVLHALGAGPEKIGQWSYASNQEDGILAGLTYVNIHSTVNPPGEIRGQIEFAEPPCAGDVDCNGVVEFQDILEILAVWGPYKPCPPYLPQDLDEDCAVAFSDILIVLANWGNCP